MSDTTDMYQMEEDGDSPAPTTPTPTQVKIDGMGNIRRIRVEGEEVLVIHPSVVENLARDLAASKRTLQELHDRIRNITSDMGRVQEQLRVMNQELARKINRD